MAKAIRVPPTSISVSENPGSPRRGFLFEGRLSVSNREAGAPGQGGELVDRVAAGATRVDRGRLYAGAVIRPGAGQWYPDRRNGTARRIPSRKVKYFAPVAPRFPRNTVIESTFVQRKRRPTSSV
jgi:hypothetical protein